MAHEVAINLINERCTCRRLDDDELLEYKTPVASNPPSLVLPVPEAAPLLILPLHQVGGIVMPSFGEANNFSISS